MKQSQATPSVVATPQRAPGKTRKAPEGDRLSVMQSLADASPVVTGLATMQHMANASQGLAHKAHPAPLQAQTIQRVQIAGVSQDASNTYIKGDKKKKHVAPAAAQEASAEAGFGTRTFVTDEKLIVDAVVADTENIPAGDTSKKHISADVVISQWDKTNPPTAGYANGQPVAKSIDEESHACDIGVKLTGENKIQVWHFQKEP